MRSRPTVPGPVPEWSESRHFPDTNMPTPPVDSSRGDHDPAVALPVERHRLAIACTTAGRLVPWLGPAIRGMVALRHRAAVCSQPRETWSTTWRYCRGCPQMASCGYGSLFEPENPPGFPGPRDAPRPLVMEPAFPVPLRAGSGMRFTVDILAIGSAAAAGVPGVIRALGDAGRLDGLGSDRVRFEVVPVGAPERRGVLAADLPRSAAAEPVAHDVTIRLRGPLFIRESSRPGRRRHVDVPGLGHLLRASMRTARDFLGEAATRSGQGPPDFAGLASSIEPASVDLRRFTQERSSHRSGERFALDGVIGSWTFATLPICLVPWLQLGGMLHAGGHRIAGAGGWDVLIGGAAPPQGAGR